jgi:hypothetical protein
MGALKALGLAFERLPNDLGFGFSPLHCFRETIFLCVREKRWTRFSSITHFSALVDMRSDNLIIRDRNLF